MQVGGLPGVSVPDGFFLRQKVAIAEIKGGKPTNPLWMSDVGNPEFKGALEESLRSFGLLAADAGAYDLSATLISVNKPLVGFDLTVTAVASYSLTERTTKRVLFEESITTPYTADFSSSFLAVERLRLANEGSIKANLEQLIRALLGLKPN
jgi:hypothetical protein